MADHDVDPLGLERGGEGAITGTVVCAAAIAYGATHLSSIAQLCVAIIGTVAVYWIAHLHAVTIGSALTHRHQPLAALRHALAETIPLLFASVAPLAVLLVGTAFGMEMRDAAWVALSATVALLALYSYVGARRSGLDMGARIACSAAGAGIGVLVVLLKVALH